MAAWTANQIVTYACQEANCPGFVQQAQDLLNMILDELAQTYDFDITKGRFNFNFDPGTTEVINGVMIWGGPYKLPADYLRAVDDKSAFWYLNGVPYPMVPIDLSEFDMAVQQAGFQSYPYWYTTDLSQTPPVMWVYPPPSGSYPVSIRYRRQMPVITDFTTSPWFPNTSYLMKRLTGELMLITGDERAQTFLGDTDGGAQGLLKRYLKLHDDHENRAETISMDRRRFGTRFNNLPITKQVGWVG